MYTKITIIFKQNKNKKIRKFGQTYDVFMHFPAISVQTKISENKI